MKYIGVDLAWSDNNYSGVALLEDNKLLELHLLKGVYEIARFIKNFPDAIVAVDAPLKVENDTGNREIEKEFLKDYSSKKLGVYPVNRKLLSEKNGCIAGEELALNITQKLGINLFEVYPHVTIMNCFHGSVLPYKRKKGRNTAFIKEQLEVLKKYLKEVIKGDFETEISRLKGKALKDYEDKLDAIVCAYSLYFSDLYKYKLYGGIFKVPINEKIV